MFLCQIKHRNLACSSHVLTSGFKFPCSHLKSYQYRDYDFCICWHLSFIGLKFLLSHTQGISSLWIPNLPFSQTHSVCFLLQGSFPAELAVLLASGCFQKFETLLIPLGNLRIKDLCFLLGNDDAIIYSSAVFCLLFLGRISKALIS